MSLIFVCVRMITLGVSHTCICVCACVYDYIGCQSCHCFLPTRDDLREHLKNAPKMIMAQHQAVESSDTSSSSESGKLHFMYFFLYMWC